MANLIQNNKLRACITNAPKEELAIYVSSIDSIIDFYLCKDPYEPINQSQAGVIYFLKWLKKSLVWEPVGRSRSKGNIICHVAKNDICLLESFIESLEQATEDINHYGTLYSLNPTLKENLSFIEYFRSCLIPSLDQVREQINLSVSK